MLPQEIREWISLLGQSCSIECILGTHSSEGEGLLFYGNIILPFVDRFPKDTELYRIMTTKPQEQAAANGTEV